MYKKTLLSLSLLVLVSLLLTGCQLPFVDVVRGSGNVVSENRPVSGFDAITLDGAGKLVITQGDSESLEIQAEDNLINELSSDVQGNTLVLGYEGRPWRKTLIPTEMIVYNLTITDLNEITFNGAGDLEMESLETEGLTITTNGAGRFNIDSIQADELTIVINGTASFNVAGEATMQSISIDGAGTYRAGDLQTQQTVISINGLGNSTVWATESLDVTINGGGNLDYYGNPNVTQDINGVGNISNMGEK